MFTTIVTFALVLSLLVFVHEFGHFITAKKSGMRVDEFGFGFPPRIFGIKKGGTLYSVNWIPLGGFVKIKGEGGEDRADEDSFANKSGWVRGLVLTAGVMMNVLLAWFLLSLGYLIGMPQIIEDGQLSKYARVSDAKIQVIQVLADSAADKADLQPGDAVVSIDGIPAESVEQVRTYAESHGGASVHLVTHRKDQTIERDITPLPLPDTGRPAFGVALVKSGFVSYPLWLVPAQGAVTTWSFLSEIVGAFADMIRNLFAHQQVSVDISGPVGIAALTGEVAKMGIRYLIQFTALLSLNLAVINILPLPALDGGRVMFLIVEKLRGRAVSQKVEVMAHNIGFVLLMGLVILVTLRDLSHFFGRG